ncbi:MAG TPA: hypothetical protein VHQ24_10360, partial [Lachnospiraceae bacterium]|nr:hypothetical protein [Lachnospiraceae bacterium]
MKRLSVRMTTIIDLVSIITLIIQFGFYYVTSNIALTVCISCILLLICAHLFLTSSNTFESIFLYSFILILLSSCIIGFIYMKGADFDLNYRNNLLLLILLNWILPMIYSTIRFLHDSRQRFSDYDSYFKRSSTQFVIYYVGLIALLVLNKPIILVNADGSSNGSNFIPFYHVAAYIEDYVYNQIDLQRLILYITAAITLYIPYGFYLSLLLRNAGHLLFTGFMLLLPVLVEICQYYFTT